MTKEEEAIERLTKKVDSWKCKRPRNPRRCNMKYTHWLKIENDMIEQVWIRLKEYKEKYDCNMEVFYKDTNLINKFIKLECNQSYQDLDLDVNSLSDNGLRHLDAKPKMIHPYNCPIEEFFKEIAERKSKEC